MDNLLTTIRKSDVRLEPFPHIIIRDPVPTALCDQLLMEYPSLSTITRGASYSSNERFSYAEAGREGVISPLWREFLQAHVSRNFWVRMVELFGESILVLAPWLATNQDSLKSVPLEVDSHKVQGGVSLSAQICINTPVIHEASSVKIAHLDNPLKLFAGLWYLRPPGDLSQGGALELYRYNRRRPAFHGRRLIEPRYIERFARVEYEHNVLVLFLNSFHALHGVTPREVTPHNRYLFNLFGEVECPLFNLAPYQETLFQRVLRYVSR
jgi:hypothetical protein